MNPTPHKQTALIALIYGGLSLTIGLLSMGYCLFVFHAYKNWVMLSLSTALIVFGSWVILRAYRLRNGSN